ncbi:hypothetical protein PYCCODRAFT_733962 [Trametes coccinea BRFM310]|uniref:Uncharacterized protein n=1 Tax=Trametes coccinea (strain BRFM310) TaxID=1353009 RepID=A0A1Y2IFH7_TRAC3|nr:hypothetical protein PYCCODRAFT_733962 [Trametes coccinea BRFM310]
MTNTPRCIWRCSMPPHVTSLGELKQKKSMIHAHRSWRETAYVEYMSRLFAIFTHGNPRPLPSRPLAACQRGRLATREARPETIWIGRTFTRMSENSTESGWTIDRPLHHVQTGGSPGAASVLSPPWVHHLKIASFRARDGDVSALTLPAARSLPQVLLPLSPRALTLGG